MDKLSLKILRKQLQGRVYFVKIESSDQTREDEYARRLAMDVVRGKRSGLINVMDELIDE